MTNRLLIFFMVIDVARFFLWFKHIFGCKSSERAWGICRYLALLLMKEKITVFCRMLFVFRVLNWKLAISPWVLFQFYK